jgi:hypothetical protein
VSGSWRNEVPEGGWSEAELCRSLPTTLTTPYIKKRPTLLGQPLCVYRAKIANICRDLLLRLLERDDFYCAGNLIVFFRREMDDPLV